MADYPYLYNRKNNPKRATLYGRRCRVLARGKMNSALVEFQNGQREIISRNALKKVKEEPMPRKSKGQYPHNWKEIAKQVKDEADWICIRCKHPHSPKEGYTLTVHHLDLDPSNCRWWNLAPLCQRCHLHIQAKVIMERVWMLEHSEWFKPFVAGYYAFHHGFLENREFVTTNLDHLIAIGQGRNLAFETLEEMARFCEAGKGKYDMSFGPNGARLLRLSDYKEVAFVEDDRAAVIALQLLSDRVVRFTK